MRSNMISEIKKYRKVFVAAIMAVMGVCGNAANMSMNISPKTVVVGEPATLNLVYSGKYYPVIVSQPEVDGLTWLGGANRRNYTSIINGQATQTSTSSYAFRVSKPGKYTIPSMKVSVAAKDVYKTPEVTFTAIGGGSRKVQVGEKSLEMKDLMFGKVILDADETTYYVGQEIPMEIKLYVLRGIRFNPSWPKVDIPNALFSDFSKENRENRNFKSGDSDTEQVNGRLYTVYSFKTAFRVLVPGQVKGAADIGVAVQVQQNRSRRSFWDDDFFSGFNTHRTVNQTINVKVPQFTVKALPAAPVNSHYLGLVGIWSVQYELDGKERKVGEPITLKIKIRGTGGLESLDAPKLELSGFRVYPPEIKRSTYSGVQTAEISYMLIPRRPGNTDLKMSVSTFSCIQGKYQTHDYEKLLKIAPGEQAAAPQTVYSSQRLKTVNNAASNPETAEQKPEKPHRPVGILHLKTKPSGAIEIPLWRNYQIWYLLLILGGPIIWGLNELRIMRHRTLQGDEKMRRKRDAQSNRGRVLKALHKVSDEHLDDAINNEVVPYLNDLLGLPPGTTATELSGKVDDEELANCLKSSGNSSYMPGAVIMEHQELRRKMIKALKRISVVLLFLGLACQVVAAPVKTKVPQKINSSSEAKTAYEGGEFKRAAEWYHSKIDRYEPDAAWLYNLGNCYYQMRDYPAALLCFERARLLEPGDSDIIENLNRTREDLFQKRIGDINNPVDLVLRISDSLRPDQWLLLAAAGWFAFWLFIACRRYYNRNKLTILLIASVLVIGAGMAAAIYENGADYNDKNAIILLDGAKVYSLPSDENGVVVERLRGGDRVDVIEPRVKWSLIRKNGTEGWVHADSLAKIAPGGRLPKLK